MGVYRVYWIQPNSAALHVFVRLKGKTLLCKNSSSYLYRRKQLRVSVSFLNHIHQSRKNNHHNFPLYIQKQ